MNDVVCEGLEWVRLEIAQEQLRREFPSNVVAKLSPFAVIMNAAIEKPD